MKHLKPRALAVAVSALSLSIVGISAFAWGGFSDGFAGKPGMDVGAGMPQKLDDNADGIVTLEEFTTRRTNRAEQRFDALDQNDDGAASAEEYETALVHGFRGRRGGLEVDQAALQQCMEDQGVENVGRPTWDELAAAADTSGDGLIDQTEFLAQQQTKAKARFAVIDANVDGALDEAELETTRSLIQEQREVRRVCIMEQRELIGRRGGYRSAPRALDSDG